MLKNFSITSFRGIDRLSISLGERTYIQGINWSGKTHILDAIHLLSGAQPLYGHASLEPWCVFEGIFTTGDLPKSYRYLRDEKRDFFALQGTKTTRPKYMHTLPWRTVHISPFDMNLLYFAPSIRRDAMDLILARTYEQFSWVRRDYDMTMRQRNALLKKVREWLAQREDLDFWDIKFAESCELYWIYRKKYISYIQWSLARFPAFFSKYPIIFTYSSSIDSQKEEKNSPDTTDVEVVASYLRKNRERDILTGHTHIGPHRDDWGFTILNHKKWTIKNEPWIMQPSVYDSFAPQDDNFGDTISAESYLSRGEMKMLLLGLKMIEADFLSQTLSIPVILLVDDIFAELDEVNSDTLLKSLTTYQVILTSQKSLPNHEKYHDFICINLEDS